MKHGSKTLLILTLLTLFSNNQTMQTDQLTKTECIKKICCYLPTCCGFFRKERREICGASCLFLCCNRDLEDPKVKTHASFCERLFCVFWIWACCALPWFEKP